MGPLLAAILIGSGSLLADREVKVFERAAAKEIAARLDGPDKVVTVKVVPDGLGALWGALDRATIRASRFSVEGLPLFTEPGRSKAGRCGNLSIELDDFTVRGLHVDALRASIPACRYDRGLALSQKSFRLSRSGIGRGYVRLTEKAVADYIVRKFHEVKSVTVKFDRGVAWVEGYGEFLIVKSTFTVIADLVPVEGTKLSLANAKVWFDWKRAEPATADILLKTLNPVVDFDADLGLLDAMKIDKVRTDGGVIEAWGTTRIPTRPKGQGFQLR